MAYKKLRLSELDEEMKDTAFWEDQEKARKKIAESNALKDWIQPIEQILSTTDYLETFYPEAKSSKDTALIAEMESELSVIEKNLRSIELKRMLSSELDPKFCTLEINAGAGGTESCDWVSMLARMYERWFQKRGWKYLVLDRLEGEVAGLKHILFQVESHYAYGFCKAEKGVHRLVRISPFDASGRRHTSFASVEVAPSMDEEIPIEVRPEDIRIDTYRASGAGGQHVNKTDSAVRITHLKTGIVVSSQQERSQIQNRERCMKMLKDRLYELEVAKKEAALKNISGEQLVNGWGSQIRSYVLQPYQMCKDLRTEFETSDVEGVLDGDLDPFVESYLKNRGS
ncbi:MAG: peptide chain release factor 2 [Chlamydiae bacterium]|nr:peptide chain release factor 2 [Chlamydiota bacterium]